MVSAAGLPEIFQSLIKVSAETVANPVPSGEKATALTAAVCPPAIELCATSWKLTAGEATTDGKAVGLAGEVGTAVTGVGVGDKVGGTATVASWIVATSVAVASGDGLGMAVTVGITTPVLVAVAATVVGVFTAVFGVSWASDWLGTKVGVSITVISRVMASIKMRANTTTINLVFWKTFFILTS